MILGLKKRYKCYKKILKITKKRKFIKKYRKKTAFDKIQNYTHKVSQIEIL